MPPTSYLILVYLATAILVFAPIGWILIGLRKRQERVRFRDIFGEDALFGSNFHAVHTDFTVQVSDQNGNPVKHIYRKSKTRKTSDEKRMMLFSIEHPVSSASVRALNHVAAAIQRKSKEAIKISRDYDLDAERDISFVSFGGPMSNYKTEDINDETANDLARFDEGGTGFFVDAQTGDRILERKPGFDYGLILKIHPTDHPKRTWLACAGYSEWGTSGAAWYLANHWEDIYQYAEREPFAVVVEVQPGQDESARLVWGKSAGRFWGELVERVREKPPPQVRRYN